MKVLALLFLVSFQAQANLLRVQTLSDSYGDDLDGSLYYSDESNIFHNPAELYNAYPNGIYFQEDEGGYFKKNGRTAYGLYYGRDDRDFTNIRSELGGFGNITSDRNAPVQLFFSRNSRSAAWGASLSYLNETSKASTATETENISVIKGSLGYTKRKYDIFLNYTMASGENALSTPEEYDGGLNILAGFKYRTKKWNSYFVIKKNDYEYGAPGSITEAASTKLLAGAGRKLKSRKHMFTYYYSLNFSYETSSEETSTTSADTKEYSLPLQLGIEYPLFSWLELRAGANYLFMRNSQTTGDVEAEETGGVLTGPRLGGTITYKKMTLDFLYDSGFDQGTSGNDGVDKVGQLALTVKW